MPERKYNSSTRHNAFTAAEFPHKQIDLILKKWEDDWVKKIRKGKLFDKQIIKIKANKIRCQGYASEDISDGTQCPNKADTIFCEIYKKRNGQPGIHIYGWCENHLPDNLK